MSARNTDVLFSTGTMRLWHPLRNTMIGVLGVSFALLAANSTAEVINAESQEVMERAESRWAALLENDFAKAYSMTSPSFRSATTLEQFRGRFGGGVRWTNIEVEDAHCEENRCLVSVAITYEVVGQPYGGTRTVQETWIRSRGEWWHHKN